MKKKVMFALLLCALLAAGCAGEPEPAQDSQTVQSGEGGEAAPAGTASELGSLKSFTAGRWTAASSPRRTSRPKRLPSSTSGP